MADSKWDPTEGVPAELARIQEEMQLLSRFFADGKISGITPDSWHFLHEAAEHMVDRFRRHAYMAECGRRL